MVDNFLVGFLLLLALRVQSERVQVKRSVETEPRVLFNLSNGDALEGVWLQHPVNQVLRRFGEELWHVVLGFANLSKQVRNSFFVKWQFP